MNDIILPAIRFKLKLCCIVFSRAKNLLVAEDKDRFVVDVLRKLSIFVTAPERDKDCCDVLIIDNIFVTNEPICKFCCSDFDNIKKLLTAELNDRLATDVLILSTIFVIIPPIENVNDVVAVNNLPLMADNEKDRDCNDALIADSSFVDDETNCRFCIIFLKKYVILIAVLDKLRLINRDFATIENLVAMELNERVCCNCLIIIESFEATSDSEKD